MQAILMTMVLGTLTLGLKAAPAEAQLGKRVQERLKQKVAERKAETEERLVTHATVDNLFAAGAGAARPGEPVISMVRVQ